MGVTVSDDSCFSIFETKLSSAGILFFLNLLIAAVNDDETIINPMTKYIKYPIVFKFDS